MTCAHEAANTTLYWKLLTALEEPGDCIVCYRFGTDYSLTLETESFYTLVLSEQDLEALAESLEHYEP